MKGITIQSRKGKARLFQQEVRDAILERFPQLEPDDCKSVSMGAGGEDVQLSPAARKLLPIQIECKRVKTLKGIYGWYNQAKAHGKHEPAVFFRADREQPLVVVSATHYLNLLKQLGENNG